MADIIKISAGLKLTRIEKHLGIKDATKIEKVKKMQNNISGDMA